MPQWGFLLMGVLSTLFFILMLEVIHLEQREDLFIDNLNWKGDTILIGDMIIIKTVDQCLEGIFRGIIAGKDKWIFRFSTEGQPKVELTYYDLVDIKKVADQNNEKKVKKSLPNKCNPFQKYNSS